MEISTSFGLWLQKRRRALDLTQAALAECVGCSVVTIRKIEADERRPSRQVVDLLADCLEITPEDRPTFLKVARAELRVDRLENVKTFKVQTLNVDAPAVLSRPSISLPIPPTPLLGREHELAQIARLLQNPQCRLLTLIGPGGIGKTRLALEAAAHQREVFADGVYFVPLVSVSDSEFIVPTMADAIGFTFFGPADPQAQLLNYLRNKRLLLVLDNLEHLLEGIGMLPQMLQQSPGIKLLTTSRERLNLPGEWVFEMQGLPVPPADQTIELEQYSAAMLFLQSARRAQVGFELAPVEWPTVARICRLVEGMPLGLELAATWVRVLSCQDIAQEIERNLDFLTSSHRDPVGRHQSLRAVFDHSWKLLSAEERQVLRQLSVFRGGFQLKAAEQVAGATLPLLLALVDKSLLRRTTANRYDLHELVRQYAAMHLRADSLESQETCERHSRYYLAWLHTQEKPLKGPQQITATAEVTTEFDNVRAAWHWATTHHDTQAISQAGPTLYWLFEMRSWFHEGFATFQQAVAAFDLSDEALADQTREWRLTLGWCLAWYGYYCFRSGQFGQVQALFIRSLSIMRSLEVPSQFADVQCYYGAFLYMSGNFSQGEASLGDAMRFYRSHHRYWEWGSCHFHLGNAAQLQGKVEEAYQHFSEALTLVRTIGDPVGINRVLSFLSAAAYAKGAYAETEALAQESLKLARPMNDLWSMAEALHQLGLVTARRDEYEQARQLLQESHTLFKNLFDPWSCGRVLNNLARIEVTAGNLEEADSTFRQALATTIVAQVWPIALDALVGLAMIRAAAPAPEQSLILLTLALNHPAILPPTKNRAEQLQLEVVTKLTPFQLEAAQTHAQVKPLEVLVQEILTD